MEQVLQHEAGERQGSGDTLVDDSHLFDSLVASLIFDRVVVAEIEVVVPNEQIHQLFGDGNATVGTRPVGHHRALAVRILEPQPGLSQPEELLGQELTSHRPLQKLQIRAGAGVVGRPGEEVEEVDGGGAGLGQGQHHVERFGGPRQGLPELKLEVLARLHGHETSHTGRILHGPRRGLLLFEERLVELQGAVVDGDRLGFLGHLQRRHLHLRLVVPVEVAMGEVAAMVG